MTDINQVVIGGRLTRDGELKDGGYQVLNFSIASNRSTKKAGAWGEEPVYIDSAIWGKRAVVLAPMMVKGAKVTLTGELKTESWQNDAGQKRSKISLQLDNIWIHDKSVGTTAQGGTAATAQKVFGDDAAVGQREEKVPF